MALAATFALALALAGCSAQPQPSAPPGGTAAPVPTAGAATRTVRYTGSLALLPERAPAGALVVAKGTGLPTNARLDLVWNTVEGLWKLAGDSRESFRGREYQPASQALSTVETNAAGAFEAQFRVPEGFGFDHDVTLLQNGVVVNKANFRVEMQVSISPTSGPVGTPITVGARGIGWQYLRNGWGLTYDNRYTGWLSAVMTAGTARAVIPAAGTPGTHLIQVKANTFTFPYLNGQQSPIGDNPVFTVPFTVTPGPPVLPAPAEEQGLELVPGTPPSAAGPGLWVDPAAGPVGTRVSLRGQGLPAGAGVEVLWYSVVGNRIGGQGWEEMSRPLGRAVVGQDGSLDFGFPAPDDVGGAHRIEARVAQERVAQASFTISPSALALEPASGPPGTMLTLHLKGVGWTETANIYHLVYDNAYLGYACGFNSRGDVTIPLPATGEPGWHFIDLYPGIYKGTDIAGLEDFKIPQLTYAADHPGERLPAFRFAFQVAAP
ncbi:MAG: hypothetical protein HY690_02780 [Chloroflexi bacterium]|nr:hypothetical protein [Chloroflexota bacterium]